MLLLRVGCNARVQYRRLQLTLVYFKTIQILQILFVSISNSGKNPYFGKFISFSLSVLLGIMWSKSNMDIKVRRLIFCRVAKYWLHFILYSLYTFIWIFFQFQNCFLTTKLFVWRMQLFYFLTKRTKDKH